MYNACIKPILMYDTSAIARTQAVIKKINLTDRKQLRHFLNIFFPEMIFKITQQQTTTKSRWKLFGHIFRQHSDTNTNEVMLQYFDDQAN